MNRAFLYNSEQIALLESIHDVDQKAIFDFKNGNLSSYQLRELNSLNLSKVSDIIRKFGFPFMNVTSHKAYKAAFLVIQHSNDLTLMQKIIDIFSISTDFQIEKRDLAFLIDRMRILKNQPQLFGTQYRVIDKTVDFFPIEDIENLNSRRREYGMDTFEDYKKEIH